MMITPENAIPVPDEIVGSLGLAPAAVWGIVWRLSHVQGKCAGVGAVAAGTKSSIRFAKYNLRMLCDAGYVIEVQTVDGQRYETSDRIVLRDEEWQALNG